MSVQVSRTAKDTLTQANLNTSHVSVQVPTLNFIYAFLRDLNTSHVSVQVNNIQAVRDRTNRFKYITCVGSSQKEENNTSPLLI